MEQTKNRSECYNIADAINEGRVLAHVKSVSKSGMSRRIVFYEIRNNKISPLTWRLADFCDYKPTKQGDIYIKGCGMDMIRKILDNVADNLTKSGFDCKAKTYQII